MGEHDHLSFRGTQSITQQVLDLQGNSMFVRLTEIPAESKLETLRLSGNRVDFLSLPDLERATNLISLHLSKCGLVGTFPTEICSLTSLKELYLSFNALSGPLPTEIGQMKELREIYGYENSLSGVLPQELGHLSQLSELVLGKNFIEGTIPVNLTSLVTLEQLSLPSQKGAKKISGHLPSFSGSPRLR